MSELKTLEDMGYNWDEQDLKAEAVKWVKFNMEEREKYTFEDRAEYTGLIDGFIEFFNLTSEDLK